MTHPNSKQGLLHENQLYQNLISLHQGNPGSFEIELGISDEHDASVEHEDLRDDDVDRYV